MGQEEGQWYILNTLTQYEKRVRDTIQRQIDLGDPAVPVYEVQFPTEKIVEVKNGVRRNIERKFFPGYVFARMCLYDAEGNLNDKVYDFVNGIKGVSKIGGKMTETEVSQWISLPGSDTPAEMVASAPQFSVGDLVEIIEGPFTGFRGDIKEIDTERCFLRVETMVFNRPTPMELEFCQVEKVVD